MTYGKLMFLQNLKSTHGIQLVGMTRRIALVSGLIQLLVALGVLFLPVFATCYVNEPDCRRETYIQMGGSIIGYIMLISMFLMGILVMVNSLQPDRPLDRRLLWVAAVSSFMVVILGAWSIGLAFLPGGALLLIAARSSR